MAFALYVNIESCMSVQKSYLLEREMATQGKRTRIEDIRRVELIAAAHRVFLEHGLQGMTSARICREAGCRPAFSPIISGQGRSLFSMVRYNNRLLMEDVIARSRADQLGAAGSGRRGTFPRRLTRPSPAPDIRRRSRRKRAICPAPARVHRRLRLTSLRCLAACSMRGACRRA